jgi:hypothetical protein
MGDWYQGFPTNVSLAATNSFLVLAGALQGALVGLIYDLGRFLVTVRRMPPPFAMSIILLPLVLGALGSAHGF